MKLKVFITGDPLTKLSVRQQERFIELLKDERYEEKLKTGIKMALALLGYELVEEE
ncbi:hypothetical protein [Niallia circulans]|uniref:Uncharacterized protein n=1 Tax=Niallia circulans TaxID=1397 RepID=A0A941JP41_NIACI|nr:hypothetical protein [Niallia circulans]MCB5235461.1 hypothetical protein [Niallia circulans]